MAAAHQKKVQRGGKQRQQLEEHHKQWRKIQHNVLNKKVKKTSKKPAIGHVIKKRLVHGSWEYKAVYTDLSTEWLPEKELIDICPLWLAIQVFNQRRTR